MVLERVAVPVPVPEEAFDAFVQLPDHADRLFEFADGGIDEKERVSHPTTGVISQRISYYLQQFIIPRGLGHVTGADNGYKIRQHCLIPDIAVISTARFNSEAVGVYHAVAPDLAIEVISPTDKIKSVIRKTALYLEADVPVWLVHPKGQAITVYEPNGGITTYRNGETLIGVGASGRFHAAAE